MKLCRFNIPLTLWLIALLLSPTALKAGDVKLIRTIEKAFSSSSAKAVSVNNLYGDVHVTSGSTSRITLKVTIVAKGRTEVIAQQLMDEVEIVTANASDFLKVYTKTPRAYGLKLGDKGLSVRYEMQVPRGNPLTVENQFGNISLGDRKGDVTVKLKNGKLVAGRLEGEKNHLYGHFSQAEIGFLRSGQMDFKFGNVTISEVGYLKVTLAGGDLNVGLARNLELYVKQGKVSIGRSDVVRGQYSSDFFTLGYLGRLLDMEVKYAETFTVAEVGADFSSIRIEESYTPVLLSFNPNARFALEANMKKGRLEYDAPSVSMTVMETPDSEDCNCTKATYLGKFGAGNRRSGLVKLEGYYGSVRISQ